MAADTIVVDRARMQALASQHERTWQRPPSAIELRGLVDNWVREEILYREGLASGMDKDDGVIRRRVVLKMTFISQDEGDVPTEAELQAWLDRHADRYRIEPTYSLRQIYLDPQRHGPDLPAAISTALAQLKQGRSVTIGDASLLPPTLDDTPAPAVAQIFGEDFAQALSDLPVDEWSDPIRSGYGLHLVRISARAPGREPPLDEVRQSVQNDFVADRAEQAAKAFYGKLRQRYSVEIELDPSVEKAARDASAAASAGTGSDFGSRAGVAVQ